MYRFFLHANPGFEVPFASEGSKVLAWRKPTPELGASPLLASTIPGPCGGERIQSVVLKDSRATTDYSLLPAADGLWQAQDVAEPEE